MSKISSAGVRHLSTKFNDKEIHSFFIRNYLCVETSKFPENRLILALKVSYEFLGYVLQNYRMLDSRPMPSTSGNMFSVMM